MSLSPKSQSKQEPQPVPDQGVTMEEIQPHIQAVMSIQQVAAFLGVSRQHVYKLIHNGLPVVSLGRRVIVLRTSLEEWLLAQQKTINSL